MITYEYVTMKELVPNWWGYDRFESKKEQEKHLEQNIKKVHYLQSFHYQVQH